MTFLNKSQETLTPNSSRLEPVSQKLPRLLTTIGWEIARLKSSIGPFTPEEIKLSAKGNGHYILTPSEFGTRHIKKVGFDTFSRAVELAMIPQKWGIVRKVDPENQSIEIFVPSKPSKRQ